MILWNICLFFTGSIGFENHHLMDFFSLIIIYVCCNIAQKGRLQKWVNTILKSDLLKANLRNSVKGKVNKACKALYEQCFLHGTSTISRTLLLNNFKRNFQNLNNLFLPIFDRQRSHYQMFWSTVISFSQKDFFFTFILFSAQKY